MLGALDRILQEQVARLDRLCYTSKAFSYYRSRLIRYRYTLRLMNIYTSLPERGYKAHDGATPLHSAPRPRRTPVSRPMPPELQP